MGSSSSLSPTAWLAILALTTIGSAQDVPGRTDLDVFVFDADTGNPLQGAAVRFHYNGAVLDLTVDQHGKARLPGERTFKPSIGGAPLGVLQNRDTFLLSASAAGYAGTMRAYVANVPPGHLSGLVHSYRIDLRRFAAARAPTPETQECEVGAIDRRLIIVSIKQRDCKNGFLVGPCATWDCGHSLSKRKVNKGAETIKSKVVKFEAKLSSAATASLDNLGFEMGTETSASGETVSKSSASIDESYDIGGNQIGQCRTGSLCIYQVIVDVTLQLQERHCPEYTGSGGTYAGTGLWTKWRNVGEPEHMLLARGRCEHSTVKHDPTCSPECAGKKGDSAKDGKDK